jgi:hypothetical protein
MNTHGNERKRTTGEMPILYRHALVVVSGMGRYLSLLYLRFDGCFGDQEPHLRTASVDAGRCVTSLGRRLNRAR